MHPAQSLDAPGRLAGDYGVCGAEESRAGAEGSLKGLRSANSARLPVFHELTGLWYPMTRLHTSQGVRSSSLIPVMA